MGAVNQISNSVSSALGTDGGGGGLIGAVEKTGQAIAEVPILKAGVIAAGAFFGGPAGAALAGSLMSRASGNSFNQSLWNGIGTGAAVAGAMYGADQLFGASGAASGGASGMGGGTGLTLGAGGQTGLTGSLGSSTGYGLGTGGTSLASMGGGTGALGSLGSGALGAGTLASSGLMQQLGTAGVKGIAGYLQQSSAQNAAQNEANQRIQSAQAAADASKFRPVGITSRFGSSNFQTDANGNLVNAGYNLAPDVQAQQDVLMGMSNPLLSQYAGAQGATAPMGAAAQRMMGLGNQYLATDPQAQAAMYLQQQQGLLAPGRASTMADLQAQMQSQGRGGFAIGGGVNGQGAANPQLQALYNAQLQQDAQLAANATQGGMDYAKFGAGFVGSGGQMLRDQYATQTAAYDPYKTAIGGAQALEGMGQDALKMGANLGGQVMQGNQYGAGMMNTAGQQAANIQGQANAPSMWGSFLGNAASSPQGQQAIGSGMNYAWDKISNMWS